MCIALEKIYKIKYKVVNPYPIINPCKFVTWWVWVVVKDDFVCFVDVQVQFQMY